ncbi:MAG: hypothetical protein IPL65_06895 [Lewinellaceae bacterium]|nr:hypothetical protein [Lewinellaceae bacterium]
MPEHLIVRDSLAIILEAISLIQERVADIQQPIDFVRSKNGRLVADAVMLRLQIISQKISRIEQVVPGLLLRHHIDPRKAIPTAYLLEMHYDEIDYELLFDFCKTELPVIQTHLLSMG